MALTCTACYDDLEPELIFCCPTKECEYMLCTPCIRRSFDDPSGHSYKDCPLCHHPIARSIVRDVIGRGAIGAVEEELRAKVELEVQGEYERREHAKKDMNEYKDRARTLYNELCERLNLRCPRCKMVFSDYDGCNALTCGNKDCKTAFCAICLQDCGKDAHGHARTHGDLFSKDIFENAKRSRMAAQANDFFASLLGEAFEVQQLVRNWYGDSLKASSSARPTGRQADNLFVMSSKEQLRVAIQNDRMGILSDREDNIYRRNGLDFEHISPRCKIPEDYKLEIVPEGETELLRVILSYREGVDRYGQPRWGSLDVSTFDEENEATTGRPKVDALINVVRSLKCGVIAFAGARCLYQSSVVKRRKDSRQLANDEISIVFNPVSENGDANAVLLNAQAVPGSRIIGINQNQRLMLLERHLGESEPSDLMFDALRDFVSGNTPTRLFDEIIVPAPKTFEELNEEQKRVAQPLLLKKATETAGPPGTGKTKTITELVRGLLECTDASALVLSERNGAIDAIADKFVSVCLKQKKNGVHEIVDLSMWNNILTFGSKGGIGPSTSLFTLEAKLRYHPELVELRRNLKEKLKEQEKITESMVKEIGSRLLSLAGRFNRTDIHRRTRRLSSGTEAGFTTRLEIINSIKLCLEDTDNIIEKGMRCNERDIEGVVKAHRTILGDLIPIGESPTNISFDDTMKNVGAIACAIKPLLHLKHFRRDEAEFAVKSIRDSQAFLEETKQQVERSLNTKARVLMCTIGSSHKLPVHSRCSEDDDSSDLDEQFEALRVSEQRTIAIFDEAGCIPSYELVGLSRLGRSITGLVAVGDKHQLPPYDPGQSFSPKRNLDDDTKIKLTTQYRVPRDIAAILNARIYKGDYKTSETCKAPDSGLVFVDVPTPFNDNRNGRDTRYVNRSEIEMCLQLIREVQREEGLLASIMILTPYKKQQRQMEYQFKDAGLANYVKVLTIDQCQGQEADYVMLSLVQRPTKFLDKHRLNVALSRVRQCLYMIGSRTEFYEATKNASWECALIASDILELTKKQGY